MDSKVAEVINRLKATTPSPSTIQEGDNSPSWLPLAIEIRDKITLLLDQLYSEVPQEVKRHHKVESFQGTNWECTARQCNGNRQAWRMDWGESALGSIKTIISDVEEEERKRLHPGPRPFPKLAQHRTSEDYP